MRVNNVHSERNFKVSYDMMALRGSLIAVMWLMVVSSNIWLLLCAAQRELPLHRCSKNCEHSCCKRSSYICHILHLHLYNALNTKT